MGLRWIGRILCLAALTGCSSFGGYERGVVVPYPELLQHQGGLAQFVEAEIRAGSLERAFYANELLLNRKLVAERLSVDDEELAAEYRDIHPYRVLKYRGSKDQLSSTEKQQLADLENKLVEAGRTSDQAFWDYLRIMESRLEGYKEARSLSEFSYTTVFGNDLIVTSARDAQLSLAPEEALLEYVFGEQGVYAFVVRGDRLDVQELQAQPAEMAAAIDALLLQIRNAPEGFSDRGPASWSVEGWKTPARQLRQMLIDPIESQLAEVKTLFLVAPGPLVNLPFQALLKGDRPLGEDYLLVHQPSFSFYKTASSRQRPRAAPRTLAIGNGDLPMAPKEAAVIASIFPDSQMWFLPTGPTKEDDAAQAAIARTFVHPATKFRDLGAELYFLEEYQNFNLLHFATHGWLAADAPLISFLSLIGGGGQDGNLTAAEIRTLDLSHTYLAFLSACHSAETSQVDRQEDLASIAGAFMVAGTPTVIGSLWPVNDTSTVALALAFYESFLVQGPGEALRRASQWIRSGAISKDHAHPYFWAPFNIYGVDR
jgi:CHAT domain-containing protein